MAEFVTTVSLFCATDLDLCNFSPYARTYTMNMDDFLEPRPSDCSWESPVEQAR